MGNDEDDNEGCNDDDYDEEEEWLFSNIRLDNHEHRMQSKIEMITRKLMINSSSNESDKDEEFHSNSDILNLDYDDIVKNNLFHEYNSRDILNHVFNNESVEILELLDTVIPEVKDFGYNEIGYMKERDEIIKLYLPECGISSISHIVGLKSLSQLRHLCLFKNNISTLEDLPLFPQLEFLDVGSNNIHEIIGIERMNKLFELDLSCNFLKKTTGLDTLVGLRSLDFGFNEINLLEEIEMLTDLINIDLRKNNLQGLDGLATLSKLETLDVSDNNITNIYGISSLNNLRSLNLSNNNIMEISNLNSLKILRSLNLSGNKIDKIQGLNKLSLLNNIDLSQNNISYIDEELSSIPNIKKIDLQKNPIDFPSLRLDNTNMILNWSKKVRDWTPQITWDKIIENKQLDDIDYFNPYREQYFPDLNMYDKKELRKYAKWDIKSIFEKLSNNIPLNTYELNHYLFIKNWREIELKLQHSGNMNDAINDLYEYLEKKFSVKRRGGFKILL